jgi:hypothetical protein
LLPQKFKGVRCYPFQFEKISRNENKINLVGTSILDDAPKYASDCFSFSIPEAGRKPGCREAGIEMEVGCMDKAHGFHGSLWQIAALSNSQPRL